MEAAQLLVRAVEKEVADLCCAAVSACTHLHRHTKGQACLSASVKQAHFRL